MIKGVFTAVVLLLCLSCGVETYKDSSLPANKRAKDLINRMTIEEKVGQLLCPIGFDMFSRSGDTIVLTQRFKDAVANNNIGMLWAVFRADPWSQKSLDNGLHPQQSAILANMMQRYIIENTRLAIPLFIAEEAPHGHMAIGSTTYPTGIAMASTWSPELLERIGGAISKDIRATGGHISYGPVLDLARDPRWSRVEETFGEDQYLVSTMGEAVVRGNGGGVLKDATTTISTLKHFCAYAVPEGGHNGNGSMVGERELRESYMPPFKRAIDAGALSVMTSYNSVDNVPSTASSFLFNDVLRGEWGFKGFVVSDLCSIDGLHGDHFVAKSLEDAAMMALKAGVDVDLGATPYQTLVESVKNGLVKESVIDKAVERVLTMKFEMGLFENPYVDENRAEEVVSDAGNVALALEAAQKSIVLLENKKGLLPLKRGMKVAVVGPNADNVYNMLGDYTSPQKEGKVVTVREGIEKMIGAGSVKYVKGCAIRDTKGENIAQAVAAAKSSDVVVVVVGGSSARDFKTSYIGTGAAVANSNYISDMDAGEGFDRATLDLLGLQNRLLQSIKSTGKPMVVIYIEGRPLDMNWARDNADALLTAWYPGEQGGNAIADVLFGEYNPAGRLPISIPRTVGQIPVYYNKRSPKGHDYMDCSAKPLYCFGYGLSYSNFVYENLRVESIGDKNYKITVGVSNVSDKDGEDVPQLYVRQRFASTDRPLKQLCGFQRVHITAHQKRDVEFVIGPRELSIINAQMQREVESGEFEIMIGSSSDDIRLKETIIL